MKQNDWIIVGLISFLTGCLAATGASMYIGSSIGTTIDERLVEFQKKNQLASIKDVESTAIKKDSLALFLSKCPAGWREFVQARGRYLVMSGDDGAAELIGKQVGMPLAPNENRATGAHRHTFKADEHVARQGSVLMQPATGPNAAAGAGHAPRLDRMTDAAMEMGGTALKPGTNAPYIYVNVCLKN